MKKQTLSILGCGWLGYPLGRKLLEKGYLVRGSSRDPNRLSDLERSGIVPFSVDTEHNLYRKEIDTFWDSDTLLINIPPGRRRGDVLKRHPVEIESILNRAQAGTIRKILFVSSTSVYDSGPGTKIESDLYAGNATRSSGQALRIIEQRLRSDTRFDWCILRPGGLYGYDRHPAYYLAGKRHVSGGDRPVNLVHRDDLIRAIEHILDAGITGEDFNIVSDKHPTREEFYRAMARIHNLDEPQFKETEANRGGKVVSSEKIKEMLGFRFQYPNPLDPAP
ncbi:MAG: SDR family oxidoreductase [Balneolaceae bacterium]